MAMTNDEITNEFESLFGEGSDDEEIEETSTEDEPETNEDEDSGDDSESEGEEEESEEEESEEEPEAPKDKQKAKQNYAFAQQRQQIKAHEAFMKQLGSLIGMADAKPEEVQKKVQEVLLEKQSKEQNVPVELLQRLENAEAIIRENQEIKLQNEVQNSFADLVEEHSLEPEQVEEFTQWLIDNNKNPMEHPEVDIKAEYLKLHYADLVKIAVDEALSKEHERQDKAKNKSASATPGGGGDPGESKIETVQDLDKFFGSMNL